MGNFSFFRCRLLILYKIYFFKKFISVKQYCFDPDLGPKFCRSWFGSKLFAKVISEHTSKEKVINDFWLSEDQDKQTGWEKKIILKKVTKIDWN